MLEWLHSLWMEPKKIDPKYFNLILAEIFDKTQIISLIAKLYVS